MRLSFVRPLPPLTASSYVLHHLSVDKWQQAQRPQDAEDSRDDHTKGDRKKSGPSRPARIEGVGNLDAASAHQIRG